MTTDGAPESRSVQKRKAVQRGKPMPTFDQIPYAARLTDEQFEACRPHPSWQWSADDFALAVARAAEDHAWHSRDAEVAHLQDEADDLRGRMLPEGAQPDSFPIGSEQFHAYMNVNLEQLEKELDAALAQRDTLVGLVNEQAEDEALWFIAESASEAYLQQEFRRLHTAIEDLPKRGETQ